MKLKPILFLFFYSSYFSKLFLLKKGGASQPFWSVLASAWSIGDWWIVESQVYNTAELIPNNRMGPNLNGVF